MVSRVLIVGLVAVGGWARTRDGERPAVFCLANYWLAVYWLAVYWLAIWWLVDPVVVELGPSGGPLG